MTEESLQDKLQRAYHAMLETVEALIEKEGKTVRDAVYTAEEKLSEWEELSKEEIRNISDEIKDDLEEFGETLYGARKAFREKARLDARYLAEATWEKLSEIADKSTVQLIQFKESLQENAREVSEEQHEDEHHEHQHWHSDHELWLSEIDAWVKDHEEAQDKLDTIKRSIKNHRQSLEEHRQAILAHEKVNAEHEHIISEAEKDPSSQVAAELDEQEEPVHEVERRAHKLHAQFHAKVKAHHHRTMALIRKLEKHINDLG